MFSRVYKFFLRIDLMTKFLTRHDPFFALHKDDHSDKVSLRLVKTKPFRVYTLFLL